MASQNSDRSPMYPQLDAANPHFSASSTLYPTVAAHVSIPQTSLRPDPYSPSAPPEECPASSELLVKVSNTVLNLIDEHYSVELSSGDLQIHRLTQGDNAVAAVACVDDDVQWPLTKDLAAVKVDSSHYFFSFMTRL